ncbi:hypothetical protein Tco_0664056 [Tanacetum coccineum]
MEYLHEKFRPSSYVDEMTYNDDEKWKFETDGEPCHVTSRCVDKRRVKKRPLWMICCWIGSAHSILLTKNEDLIWSKSDGLTLNGTLYHDTFQFKKSTNIIGSRKVSGVWSLGFLRILKKCKVPLVGKNGLTVVRNFEDLTELSKSKSYEFMLNHKRDDKIPFFIGLTVDLTIDV